MTSSKRRRSWTPISVVSIRSKVETSSSSALTGAGCLQLDTALMRPSETHKERENDYICSWILPDDNRTNNN
jgi:hypothetical protein